jgi:UDP-N-acetyl-D-glucosamine dehydrogenase
MCYKALAGRPSQAWGDFSNYDAVLIATDHDDIDYVGLAKTAKLIVDTRNACRRAGVTATNVVGA